MMKPHEAFLYSILLISYTLILWTSYQVYCHTYQKILNPLGNEQKLASFYRYQANQSKQSKGKIDGIPQEIPEKIIDGKAAQSIEATVNGKAAQSIEATVNRKTESCWFAIKFDEDLFHFVNHIDHYDTLKAWLSNQSCIDQILEGQMISVHSVKHIQHQQGINCQASFYQMTTQDKLAFSIIDYPKPKLCFKRAKSGVMSR